MILLPKKSILRALPKSLRFDQHLILNAMRFTIDIIQINYNQLLKDLKNASLKKSKNIPRAFNSAWNIIDNTQRLNEIYKKYPQQSELTLFKDIADIKFFRHSYQHLEDRINEIIIDKQLPVFGALKWAVNDKGGSFSCLAISGTFYGKETTIINPADPMPSELISKITLITTVRQNKKTTEKEINISDLIKALKDNIKKLEVGFNVSLKKQNLIPSTDSIMDDLLLVFRQNKTIA